MLDLNPASHSDVDQSLINNLPTTGTGLSDLITLSTPGGGGRFERYVPSVGRSRADQVRGRQPADQRSAKPRVSPRKMPENAFQNMEMITGSAAAQYGDKTSLVVEGVTRSGLGKQPFGEFDVNYGSFGTAGEKASFGFGGPSWAISSCLIRTAPAASSMTRRIRPDARRRQRPDLLRPHRLSTVGSTTPSSRYFCRPQLVPDSQFL